MYTTEIVLQKFTERQRPVLSVHDSYIVQTTDVRLLQEAMSEASKKLTGIRLELNKKYRATIT